jgi:hypothetical protein
MLSMMGSHVMAFSEKGAVQAQVSTTIMEVNRSCGAKSQKVNWGSQLPVGIIRPVMPINTEQKNWQNPLKLL